MNNHGIFSEAGFLPANALQDRVERAMTVLVEAGIQEGDGVALLLRNGVPFIEATMAAQNLGAYAVPINWHFAVPEIVYVLKDCGAAVLISEGDLLERIAETAPELKLFSVGPSACERTHQDWDNAVTAAAQSDLVPRAPVQSMIYTSGTTGKPKGVRRAPSDPAQADAMARMRKHIYGHEAGMRALLAAPLYHSAPNFFALNSLRLNGSLILPRRFDPEQTLQLIEEHSITHMFMVPTMFVRLLALPRSVRARFEASSLRWVLHAGAPCPPSIKAAMIDWWGPVLTEYYGSTEMGPLTFCTSHEWLERPGTVGRALEGVSLSVRGAGGEPCGAGEAGEICVEKSFQADFTYHGDDAKRQAVETGHGLATGDIGYCDDAGYFFICDRRTDMIISGGVNIYPAEIEAALMEVPGIADCAVIGVHHAEFGETVVAFIQPEGNACPTSEDIAAALRDRIAGYKIPREFRFTQALPRDDSGKIFKRLLREEAAAEPK